MSSSDDDQTHDRTKKRRVQRACDVCRKRKIRCDGAREGRSQCSHCEVSGLECTYHAINTAKKRVPPDGYIEYLETRLTKIEFLLQKHCPTFDFSEALGPRYNQSSWSQNGGIMTSASERPPTGVMVQRMGHALRSKSSLPGRMSCAGEETAEELESSDEEEAMGALEAHLRDLQVTPINIIGKSSDAKLVCCALALKGGFTGTMPGGAGNVLNNILGVAREHRPKHWEVYEWEGAFPTLPCDFSSGPGTPAKVHGTGHTTSGGSHLGTPTHMLIRYELPPQDLVVILVEAYFNRLNVTVPLLHRPTFEKALADGTHHNDMGFRVVLLLVCANGARFVDDERVLIDGASRHSAGWKWFSQINMLRRSLVMSPCIHDLQLCCLSAMFLQGSATLWQACWSIVGIGIRFALDIGAHRKKMYSERPTVEDELWRRAFWVLVSLDRALSLANGRPCAIHDEDFDVDLPADCDDEYWKNEDPALAFRQPPGKPSKVTFFISLIKLQRILAFALRTIYSINKSRPFLGFVGPTWQQRVVSELDSALNQWTDSIPDHLRWDPNREDLIFFEQSAHLYAAFYQLQISVHRPFIASRREAGGAVAAAGEGCPSLAICTHAARACSKLAHTYASRMGQITFNLIPAASTSALVLLLGRWGRRRTGAMGDITTEMVHVNQCLAVLKASEAQWQPAGRMWDVLTVLVSVNNVPLPAVASTAAYKHCREPVEERSTHVMTGLRGPNRAAKQPLAQHEMASKQRFHTGEAIPQLPPSAFRIPAGATALEVPLPVVSSSANAPVGGLFAPSEPAPSAWAQLIGFNVPQHDASNRISLAGGAIDPGAAVAQLPPPPVDPGEQLAAWLASANSDDVARLITGGYCDAPTSGSFGTDALDAYGAPVPMNAPVLAQPLAGSVGPDGHHPLAVWPQEPSGFEADFWNQYVNEGDTTFR